MHLLWQVNYKEHSFAEGEEVCECEFVLLWQDGPNAGNRTSSSIEHICLLQPCIQVDPRVATFLEICRVVNNISSDAGLVSEGIGSSSVRHQSRRTKASFKVSEFLEIYEFAEGTLC